MKRIYLIIVVVAISLTSSAQKKQALHSNFAKKEIYYKQDGTTYYLKVNYEGTTEYYQMDKKHSLSIFNILQNADNCTSMYYDIISMKPRQIDINANVYQDQDNTSNNSTIDYYKSAEKAISVCKKSGIEITSHSKFTVGGEYLLFQVKSSNNEELIECDVACKVVEIRKSNVSGAEGRLTICPLYIIDKNNNRIELEHDYLLIRGKNRTNIKTFTSFLLFPSLIPGEGAKVKDTDEFVFNIK